MGDGGGPEGWTRAGLAGMGEGWRSFWWNGENGKRAGNGGRRRAHWDAGNGKEAGNGNKERGWAPGAERK